MEVISKNEIRILIGAVAAGLILSGCSSTPRGLQHVPAEPAAVIDAVQTPEEQGFAMAAGRLEIGTASVIQGTPLGMAQVRAVSAYTNALGEQCKHLEVKTQDAASSCGVCLGKDGVWRYVPQHP